MLNTFFAIKSGMTGKYTPDGERVGATVLWVLPMKVADLRTKEKHGYEAVRFMIDDLRFKNKKSVREVRSDEKPEVGTEIKLEEVLKPGDIVAVTGPSKGEGSGVDRLDYYSGAGTQRQTDGGAYGKRKSKCYRIESFGCGRRKEIGNN